MLLTGMKRSDVKKLTLSAVCAGLSVVMLYLGYLSGVLDLSAIALCSLITLMLRHETGRRFAAISAAACTALSLLILPNKLMALGYAALAGAYPLLREFIPRKPVLSWIIKMILGAAVTASYLLLIRFVFTASGSDVSGVLYPVFAVAGLITFIVYDLFLGVMSRYYVTRLRPRLGIGRFLK